MSKSQFLSVYGTACWVSWVRRVAQDSRLPVPVAVNIALHEFAEKRGLSPPPSRLGKFLQRPPQFQDREPLSYAVVGGSRPQFRVACRTRDGCQLRGTASSWIASGAD